MVIFNSYASLPEGTSLSTEKSLWPNLAPAPVASPASRWCWSPRLLWPNPSRSESPNSSLFMAKSWSIRGKSVSSLMFFYRESCFSSGMMKCGGFQSESSSMNETVKIHQGHQDHPLSNIGDQIYDGNHNYSDNPCIIERGACFSLLSHYQLTTRQ